MGFCFLPGSSSRQRARSEGGFRLVHTSLHHPSFSVPFFAPPEPVPGNNQIERLRFDFHRHVAASAVSRLRRRAPPIPKTTTFPAPTVAALAAFFLSADLNQLWQRLMSSMHIHRCMDKCLDFACLQRKSKSITVRVILLGVPFQHRFVLVDSQIEELPIRREFIRGAKNAFAFRAAATRNSAG